MQPQAPATEKAPKQPKPLNKLDVHWEAELRKFVNQVVTVRYEVYVTTETQVAPYREGRRETRELTGILRAFQRHNVMALIDTDESAIFIRYPLEIKRARKSANASPKAE